MLSATRPQKRVFGEASSARRNIANTPVSAKKRRLDEPFSSPAAQFRSSQNDGKGKLASSQQKSAFETEVLERMSQDISDLKQNNTERDQMWGRPPLPSDYDPEKQSLCFQAIEAEEGFTNGGLPAVKLFGVTDNGNSVMLLVKDFKHYLYVAAPVSFTPEDCAPFQAFLEAQLATHGPVIHSISLTMRENIYGFQGNTQNPFIKISVNDHRSINRVRTAIEEGDANYKKLWKSSDGTIMTYDNIQYLLRFMVDNSVRQYLSHP